MSTRQVTKNNRGGSLLNSLINNLPTEIHIPGYQFAGPGTKLAKRLALGQTGINKLDSLCLKYDIAYDGDKNLEKRRVADKILEDASWELVKSKDTGIKEKAASWLVCNAMKVKRKLGMGCSFKDLVKAAKKTIKSSNETDIHKLTKLAVAAAKRVLPKSKRKKINTPRILNVPQKGGFIQLISLFAGLSALGSLASGATNIVKTIKEMNSTKNTPIHLGNGLFLSPYSPGKYKLGEGVYLRHENKGKGIYLRSTGKGITNRKRKPKTNKKSKNC